MTRDWMEDLIDVTERAAWPHAVVVLGDSGPPWVFNSYTTKRSAFGQQTRLSRQYDRVYVVSRFSEGRYSHAVYSGPDIINHVRIR